MKLQTICERYAAFRKTLGERFEVNGRQLKAFCRAMGPNIDIADVSPEKVNTFLVGKGPLTTSWYVRHNALLGFYRYAISRGFVTTSPLPFTIPKIRDRKSTRLNSSHGYISYAVFCLKKKKNKTKNSLVCVVTVVIVERVVLSTLHR